MKSEVIYSDKRLIIHKVKGGNKEFIDFLAQKILEYSIHPVVYDFVRTRNLTPEKAFYLAQRKIQYIKDPTRIEGIIAPPKIIKEHILKNVPIKGDCDDKVLFLGSLLVSMGYPIKVVGAYYGLHDEQKNKGPRINHVYLEYYDEKQKKWIPLEPTSTTTKFGEMGFGVIPLYKAEISQKEGKFNISYEIVPVGQKEDEMIRTILGVLKTLKSGIDTAESWLKAYAEKKGIKYEILKAGMDFNTWMRTPLTWFLLGTLGVSLFFNLTKIKK